MSKSQIAIFASGKGTNAQKIIAYFKKNGEADVALICCNRPEAGVIEVAKNENVRYVILNKEKFSDAGEITALMKEKKIDLIVLAGFLWKLSAELIGAFPKKIINIHPALLPRHGGKGMYGARVHEAVIAAGEKISGITVHYVDDIYDHGQVIFQASCRVTDEDTADSLAQKIHALEHRHFPNLIWLLLNLQNIVKSSPH
ncbi:MAG TPA: phosphoribosylglycinamide formyltransferase [Puia sp.]|nr:phosphoribosylglycinamide formyltransferase [Puia sp.]